MLRRTDFSLTACLLLVAACASAGEPQHGIVKLDGSGHIMLVVTEPLGAGQSVYFQYPNARQQAACCKRLKASAFTRTDTGNILATNEITGDQALVYSAHILPHWAEMPFAGAAAIGGGLQTSGIKGWLVVKTREGRTSRINTCTSQEGVHLIEREGKNDVAHLYLGLGYDIEQPSCK